MSADVDRRDLWDATGLMSAFVYRFKVCPYPTFTLDMSDQEREIMACHAENWRPWPSKAGW